MDLIKMLDSIDFIDGRVDLNSIHPTNLLKLVEQGYIEKIDPGDGEPCFYLISVKGCEAWAEEFFDSNRETIQGIIEEKFNDFIQGKPSYYNVITSEEEASERNRLYKSLKDKNTNNLQEHEAAFNSNDLVGICKGDFYLGFIHLEENQELSFEALAIKDYMINNLKNYWENEMGLYKNFLKFQEKLHEDIGYKIGIIPSNLELDDANKSSSIVFLAEENDYFECKEMLFHIVTSLKRN